MYLTKNVALNWYSSMEKIRKIQAFFDIENWLWMSKFHDFWYHGAISMLQISKKHFAPIDFFVKMKLVSTVWVSTSLSKSGVTPFQILKSSKRSPLQQIISIVLRLFRTRYKSHLCNFITGLLYSIQFKIVWVSRRQVDINYMNVLWLNTKHSPGDLYHFFPIETGYVEK